MVNPLSKTLRKVKDSILKRVGKAAVALVAATATLASGVITTGSALAATTDGPGYWFNATRSGSWWVGTHGSSLGPQRYENGNPVYCVEAGEPVTNTGTWNKATDVNHKVGAWLVEKHKGDSSDFTQASVAYAIHEHLDQGSSHFRQLVAAGLEGADINAVASNAANLWNDAYNTLPSNINASYAYTSGKRTGTVNPGVKNSNGQYIAGVKYTLTLNGPAKFDQTGTNTVTGTTTGQETHIPWTATGNGKVTYRVSMNVPTAAVLNSPGQDMMRASDPENQTSDVQFSVSRDFQPTVSTSVSKKQLTRGSPVEDRVTSGVASSGVASSDDEWADNVPVKFKGYYFVGDSKHILQVIKKNNGENPTNYLKRLRETDGIRQVAAATTSFTKSGQTNTVKAKAATGGIDYDSVNGLDDYQVSDEDAGLFGTWVWVEVKADQSQQDYIKGDYIDEFGKAQETSVSVLPPNHDSTVLEQESGMNKDILDEINISRLPSDYGSSPVIRTMVLVLMRKPRFVSGGLVPEPATRMRMRSTFRPPKRSLLRMPTTSWLANGRFRP